MPIAGELPFDDLESLSGETLAERFRLDKLIGKGGYGAVFSAEQVSIGRRCAVKVLIPHVLAAKHNIQRFHLEAKATSSLEHPNTIVVYDFGLDRERQLLFLAMEFIDGESLRERIRSMNQMPLEQAVWIAHQIAGSLDDAHDRGLVHRDVKPHNIMMTRRGGDENFVKVIDFGIAKFLDEESIRETLKRVTRTGIVIGTPAYMPPEQVRSQSLDGRADQYSLAACVYQMLTGQTVFTGDSPVDIATKQLTHKPRPMRELNALISAEVDEVVARALAKDRENRFEKITDFTSALAHAAGVALPTVELATESSERTRAEEETVEVVPATIQLPAAALASVETTEPMKQVEDAVPTTIPDPIPPAGDEADPNDAPPGDSVRLLEVAPPAAPPPETAWGLITVLLTTVAVVGVFLFVGGERPVRTGTAVPQIADPDRKPAKDAEKVFEPPEDPIEVVTTPDLGDATLPTRPVETRSKVDAVKQPEKPDSEAKRSDSPPSSTGQDDEFPAPEKAEPQPEPAVATTGSVTVTVVPWGDVYVAGRSFGSKRRQQIELLSGTHEIELQQSGEVVARKTVDVQPGKNTMVKLVANP